MARLNRGELHVWHASLDAPPNPDDLTLLAPDEHERARRFAFERHRHAFIARRAILRRILGVYLDMPAGRIRFAYGAHGKPALAEGGLEFNTSHSGSHLVIAVTSGAAVGVDVEQHRVLEFLALADRFFSAREVEALHALPPAGLQDGFLACWTRKEAYVKARGEGLAFLLRHFAVSFRPDIGPALEWSGLGATETGRWHLVPLDGTNWVGAVVVEGSHPQVTRREWPCERGETPPSR